MFRTIVASIMLLAAAALSYAQDSYDMKLTDTLTVVSTQYVQKRYSLYFEKGSSRVDKSYHDNGRVLEKMKSDIRTTLNVDKVIPDSLLILSTASPDGSVFLNRRLAEVRAANTKKLLLQMFPEFKDATILVDYVEENWDGLRQVLKTDPDFPQRDRMLAIIDETVDVDDKEAALKACEEGWAHLVDSHIYSLRTSSVTLCVILDGVVDEFVRMVPVNKLGQFSYTPVFEAADVPMKDTRTRNDHVWKKMILAPRMNLLAAGFNIGLEIPIKDHWSVGMDYYFPWLLDKGNRWCVQFLGGGVMLNTGSQGRPTV